MSSEVKNTLLKSIRSNLRQNQFSWILIKSGGLIITTGEESLRLKRENKTDGAVITRRHPPVTPSILSAPPAAVSHQLAAQVVSRRAQGGGARAGGLSGVPPPDLRPPRPSWPTSHNNMRGCSEMPKLLHRLHHGRRVRRHSGL